MEDLHRRLRAWAHGNPPREAGAELLIRSGLGFRGDLWETAGAWDETTGHAWLDHDRLAATVRARTLAMTTGEWHLLLVVASLLVGARINLADVLPALDARHARLVTAAVTHTIGVLEPPDPTYDDRGIPLTFDRHYTAATPGRAR